MHLFTFTDGNFSGGQLAASIGRGYTGGNNIDLPVEASDSFSYSVALNGTGDRLAVGALLDDGLGNNFTDTGAAYLFTFTDTSFSGGQLAATIGRGYTGGNNINLSTLQRGYVFGTGVALNATGDRLAVGAPGLGGAAFLFTFTDGNFSGGELAASIGNGYTGGNNINLPVEASDFFGISVALNGVGDRLAVGAFGDSGAQNDAINTGAAYLFTFTDTSFSGGQLAATIGRGYTGGNNINLSTLQRGYVFGTGVALNATGDRLAVGAPARSSTPVAAGSVYLLNFTDTSFSGGRVTTTIARTSSGPDTVAVPSLDVTNEPGSDGARGDHFGFSVAFDGAGDRLAVGASQDMGAQNDTLEAGAVYLFRNAVTPITYARVSNQDVTVSAREVASLLSAGTAVTLEASNDLTIAQAVTSTGNGALTLAAGRSVFLNSNLTTADGALTIIANDLLSNGVVDAYREAGAAVLTMAPGSTLHAGAGAVSLAIRSGTGKTHTTSGALTLGSITAGQIRASNTGPTPGSGITITSGSTLTATGTGDAVVLAGDTFTNQAGAGAIATPNGRFLVWSDTPTADTRGELAYAFKQYAATYNTTSVAQATGNGFLYTLAPSLTISIVNTPIKPYDGTTVATVLATDYEVSGLVDGDTATVTATSTVYEAPESGARTVTASGVSATTRNGAVAVYGYQQPTTVTGPGTITLSNNAVTTIVGVQQNVGWQSTLLDQAIPSAVRVLGLQVDEDEEDEETERARFINELRKRYGDPRAVY